jgi:hypothetical protein
MFTRFLDWFDKPSTRYDYITFFLPVIISPTLVVSYQKLRGEDQFTIISTVLYHSILLVHTLSFS